MIFFNSNTKRYIIIALPGILSFLISWYLGEEFIVDKKLELLSQHPTPEYRSLFHFSDMDADGIDELLFKNRDQSKNFLGIKAPDKPNYQYNLPGEWIVGLNPLIFDLEDDGEKEFAIISLKDSLIYLSIFKYSQSRGPILEMVLDTTQSESVDLHFDGGFVEDLNKDGSKELYFILTAGYGIHPRRLFKFDFDNNVLLKTPSNFGVYYLHLTRFDMDHDGKIDLITTSGTPDNIHDTSFVFGDKVAAFLVFDQNLKLKPEYNILDEKAQGIFPFVYKNELYLSFTANSIRDSSKIIKWERGKWETIRADAEYNYSDFLIIGGEHHIFSNLLAQGILEISPVSSGSAPFLSLNRYNYVKMFVKQPENHSYNYLIEHSNGRLIKHFEDGSREIIGYASSSKPGFYEEGTWYGKPSVIITSNDYIGHFFIIENQLKNWWIYLSVLIGGVVSFMGYLTRQFLFYRQEARSKELYSLQLRSLRNQVDPHFTFNLLGSIKMLIIRNKMEEAEKQFDVFIKMLRQTVINADRISNLLSEELEMVRQYLALEQFRLKNKFDYEIRNETELDPEIPKMLMQIHLENAVKHGIHHLENNDGCIQVVIKDIDGKFITISIRDNGVGREATQKMRSSSTGKGVTLTMQLLELYEKLYSKKARQRIVDREVGTEVLIEIEC